MTTSNFPARCLAASAALAAVTVLTAIPAFARPAPGVSGVVATAPGHQSKAQIEHGEDVARTAPLGPSKRNPSGTSSGPLILVTLLGGSIVVGAAGYAAGRFRGPRSVGEPAV